MFRFLEKEPPAWLYKVSLFLFLLLVGEVLYGGERAKSNIHVTHLTSNEVGIVCLNGGDPTDVKTGDVLIVSCGK